MGTCHVCTETVPDPELIDHVRLLHPDVWGDGIETWPDGSYVIHDTTFEPSDFNKED